MAVGSVRNLETLLQAIRDSRRRGQSRSRLAGEFGIRNVTVNARKASKSKSSIERPDAGEPSSWQDVTIFYSRLVQPEYDKQLREFVDKLRSLSGFPALVRLNHNKQLGTTSLAGSIGASHSRLEHSLGVLDIALLFMDELCNYMERSGHSELVRPVQRAVLILSFIHDAFHGPYGHTMDPLRKIIAPNCQLNRLDKEALAHFIQIARSERRGWLFEALNYIYDDKSVMIEDVSLLYKIYIEKELPFALEIVESTLDADRLDYILRDQAHIFLTQEFSSIEPIVRKARIREGKDGVPHIHFAEDSLDRVVQLLEQRIFLYDTIYEAPRKVPYDEMILHAVAHLFDEYGCERPALQHESNFKLRQEIFEEFVQLSDHDLDRIFDQPTTSPKIALSQLLMQDVRSNAPFAVLDYRPIQASGIAAMFYRFVALSTHVAGEFLNLQEKRIFHLGHDEITSQVARKSAVKKLFLIIADTIANIPVTDGETFRVLEPYSVTATPAASGEGGMLCLKKVDNEEIYWLCRYLGDDILMRRAVELMIWRRFQATWGEGYKRWRSGLREEIEQYTAWQDYNKVRSESEQMIDDTPLLFIACSRVPDLMVDIVLRNKGRESPIYYWREGALPERYTFVGEKGGQPSYFAMLCGPPSLPAEAKVIAQKIWDDCITNFDWFLPNHV